VLQAGDGGLGGALRQLATVAAGVVQSYNGLSKEFAKANSLSETQVAVIEAATEAATLFAVAVGARVVGSLVASAKARAADIAATAAHSKAIAENSAIEANKARVTELVTLTTVLKSKAEASATLVALNGVKAVQSQLVAERQLEVTRLRAQITETGRQASLVRLA
jgi:hypothetical protein